MTFIKGKFYRIPIDCITSKNLYNFPLQKDIDVECTKPWHLAMYSDVFKLRTTGISGSWNRLLLCPPDSDGDSFISLFEEIDGEYKARSVGIGYIRRELITATPICEDLLLQPCIKYAIRK